MSRTSLSLDTLITELQMYRDNYGGSAEVIVIDDETFDQADIIDIFAERGAVFLQFRSREQNVQPS